MIRRLILALCLLVLALPSVAQEDVTGRNDTLRELLEPTTASVFPSVAVVHRGDDRVGYAICVAEGAFLTASRAVERGGDYTLTSSEGASFAAEVGASDHQEGVTLLLCDALKLPVLSADATATLSVGQFVVAVGATASPVSAGVLGQFERAVEKVEAGQMNPLMKMFADEENAGPDRDRGDVLHHDAPVGGDEFGSALIDRHGNLLGINVDRPYRGSTHAVPLHRVDLDSLLKGEDVQARRRPFMGVQIEETPGEGITITGTVAGEAAEAAGIVAGDMIVAIDGKPTTSLAELRQALAPCLEGDAITVTVRAADGTVSDKELTLGGR